MTGYYIAENSKIADPKEIYIWLIIDSCIIYKNRLYYFFTPLSFYHCSVLLINIGLIPLHIYICGWDVSKRAQDENLPWEINPIIKI